MFVLILIFCVFDLVVNCEFGYYNEVGEFLVGVFGCIFLVRDFFFNIVFLLLFTMLRNNFYIFVFYK